MKKTILSALCFLCITPFLQNCVATVQDVQSTNLRVRHVDQDVREMREGILKEVQARQAKDDNRLDSLNSEVLSLKGRLEENIHTSRMLHEENKELLADLRNQAGSQNKDLGQNFIKIDKTLVKLDNKVMQLEERFNKLESGFSQIDSRIVQMESTVAQMTARVAKAEDEVVIMKQSRARDAGMRAQEAAERAQEVERAAEAARLANAKVDQKKSEEKRGGPQEITPDNVKKDVDGSEQEVPAQDSGDEPGQKIYDNAMDLYKKNKYKEAYGAFGEYLSKYPKGTMRVNARFWMGDCLYSQNDYELAILEYQKIIVDFPYHAKASAALLKQGLAFKQLNDKDTARIVFEKIINEYPKSEQADAAKKYLQSL